MKKINGYKFKCEHLFYVYLKKHYCPKCGGNLSRIKVSEIINSESPEGTKYDFTDVDGYSLKGNINFSHMEFYCCQCNTYYTVKEAKENKY